MFRALWQRIARLFGGGKEDGHRAPGGIPAPETLVAKVQNVRNKDRDILRVAGEALRRGHPDQAVIAYWKAVQVYLHDGQLLKAISALKMILQHSPDDLDAFHALADAYEALDRKRDAANSCLWIADVFARRGQPADALAVLYRSLDLDPGVKGARERIQALGGDLPGSARPASKMGPQLRLQSKQEPPARAPAETPPIVGIPLRPAAQPPPPEEDDVPEMPGDPVIDDDKLELDIEGDDALDFPDDSLVLPVTEAKQAPQAEPGQGTVMLPEEEFGAATIAMAAMETDPADEAGAATIAMQALDEDSEMMSDDLSFGGGGEDATVLAMEAPRWDGPTDEYGARHFEDETEPPTALPPRKFGIPTAATTVDINPPSAMVDSEHDPRKPAAPQSGPKVGAVGESTRAYSVEELRKLGVKPPSDD